MTVVLSPFAPRKLRHFRGAKGDTCFCVDSKPFPRLRFGLRWDVPFHTARSVTWQWAPEIHRDGRVEMVLPRPPKIRRVFVILEPCSRQYGPWHGRWRPDGSKVVCEGVLHLSRPLRLSPRASGRNERAGVPALAGMPCKPPKGGTPTIAHCISSGRSKERDLGRLVIRELVLCLLCCCVGPVCRCEYSESRPWFSPVRPPLRHAMRCWSVARSTRH